MTIPDAIPAAVPLDDRGLTLGDGLFETLLAVDGVLEDFDAHLARMVGGCQALGLPPPSVQAARDRCQAALKGAGGRMAVRLTLTAGSGGRGLERPSNPVPRLFATAAPAPMPLGPARVITAQARRNAGSPASRWKTLSYLDNVLARREAVTAGADEALMLNTEGLVACAAAANLFWFEGDRLCTPSLDCGVLAGIVRARVLARAAALGMEPREVRASRTALEGAESLFLTNSLIGARPVGDLDGRALRIDDPRLGALMA